MNIPEWLKSRNAFWSAVVVIVALLVSGLAKQIMLTVIKRWFAFSMYFFTMMYNRKMRSKKKELFETIEKHLEEMEGDVLEIGAGTGANFEFYPRGCSIIALDLNPHMNYYLKRTDTFYPHVTLKRYIVGSAEDMNEIEDHSVSAVVCTLLLCSVESMERVLNEVKRVLKPGGRFYFIEHVKGKGFTLTLQTWNEPWWIYFADGCRLLRETEKSIRSAGFKNVECRAFEANGVGPFIKPHIMGYADV